MSKNNLIGVEVVKVLRYYNNNLNVRYGNLTPCQHGFERKRKKFLAQIQVNSKF